MTPEHSIGGEKLSLTITRKNHDDQVVSQWSVQRWFAQEEECIFMLLRLITDLASTINGLSPDEHHMVDPRESTATAEIATVEGVTLENGGWPVGPIARA